MKTLLESQRNFMQIISTQSKVFVNWSIEEIENYLGTNLNEKSKNYVRNVIDRAFGIDKDGTIFSRYKKSGAYIKTVTCNPGLKAIETLSLRGFDYNKIIHKKWENSKLKDDIDNLVLVILELPELKSPKKNALFRAIIRFRPNYNDMNIIEKDWYDIVAYIKQNKANELDARVGEIIQSRPKARNSSDTAIAPGGHEVVKKGFFIKKPYLQEILDNFKENYEFFDPMYAIDIGDIPENKRIRINTIRVIRDTEIVTILKRKYDYKCQICGKSILVQNGEHNRYYAEAHHLKPLAQVHDGPDTKENIIILCPNHHVEFDYSVMAIDPKDSCTILHKQENNPYLGRKIEFKHKIGKEFIKYHYNQFVNRKEIKNEKITSFL